MSKSIEEFEEQSNLYFEALGKALTKAKEEGKEGNYLPLDGDNAISLEEDYPEFFEGGIGVLDD